MDSLHDVVVWCVAGTGFCIILATVCTNFQIWKCTCINSFDHTSSIKHYPQLVILLDLNFKDKVENACLLSQRELQQIRMTSDGVRQVYQVESLNKSYNEATQVIFAFTPVPLRTVDLFNMVGKIDKRKHPPNSGAAVLTDT